MLINVIWSVEINSNSLTHKRLETNGCIISTVATDALVLKHQVNSNHSADEIFIVLVQFHAKILHLLQKTLENIITFWYILPSCLRVNTKTILSKASIVKFFVRDIDNFMRKCLLISSFADDGHHRQPR